MNISNSVANYQLKKFRRSLMQQVKCTLHVKTFDVIFRTTSDKWRTDCGLSMEAPHHFVKLVLAFTSSSTSTRKRESGKQELLLHVMPDSCNLESLRPGHSRQLLSGIHLGLFQRDTCHNHTGMTKGGEMPANDFGVCMRKEVQTSSYKKKTSQPCMMIIYDVGAIE